MTNSNDYRQITGTFTISAEGNFLPIQLIYQGKTERCHAKFKFPESFDVNHSENHWSNEEKAISLIEKIILPHVTETRERLAMPAQTPWLLISDVFKGQWTPRVKNLVMENPGEMVPIPGNMTHIFQPLDVSVNRSCKAFFKTSAQQWYADQV